MRRRKKNTLWGDTASLWEGVPTWGDMPRWGDVWGENDGPTRTGEEARILQALSAGEVSIELPDPAQEIETLKALAQCTPTPAEDTPQAKAQAVIIGRLKSPRTAILSALNALPTLPGYLPNTALDGQPSAVRLAFWRMLSQSTPHTTPHTSGGGCANG